MIIMYALLSVCEICGKNRNKGNHKKCSRLKQQKFSTQRELEHQRKTREGMRKEIYLIRDGRTGAKPGFKSSLIKED